VYYVPPVTGRLMAGSWSKGRSREASDYRRRYKTARWHKRRADQLAKHPVCASCERKGKTTLATVADHVIPHRGDQYLFWYGVLQSLCAPCHDHKTSVIEARGHNNEIGPDGYPVDKAHPWYAGT
jgi:5-methylcytosine-specific restriction enzyme A